MPGVGCSAWITRWPCAIQMGIGAVIRVDFQLVVAPSVAAEVVDPLRGIGRRAGRAIEFVTPDQVAILAPTAKAVASAMQQTITRAEAYATRFILVPPGSRS